MIVVGQLYKWATITQVKPTEMWTTIIMKKRMEFQTGCLCTVWTSRTWSVSCRFFLFCFFFIITIFEPRPLNCTLNAAHYLCLLEYMIKKSADINIDFSNTRVKCIIPYCGTLPQFHWKLIKMLHTKLVTCFSRGTHQVQIVYSVVYGGKRIKSHSYTCLFYNAFKHTYSNVYLWGKNINTYIHVWQKYES